jgi:nucleotide-binding universal stress UspA family protein
MFHNILIVVDASKASSRAARHGLELAKTLCAKVTVLTVTIPSPTQCVHEFASVIPEVVMPQTGYADKRQAIVTQLLQDLAAGARRARLEMKSVHRSYRDPCRAIVDTAQDEGCDLIIMAAHCVSHLSGDFPGGETLRVMAASRIPILTCH